MVIGNLLFVDSPRRVSAADGLSSLGLWQGYDLDLADVGFRNALRGRDSHCAQRKGKAFPDLLFAPAKND
jgi:hypothetical protein